MSALKLCAAAAAALMLRRFERPTDWRQNGIALSRLNSKCARSFTSSQSLVVAAAAAAFAAALAAALAVALAVAFAVAFAAALERRPIRWRRRFTCSPICIGRERAAPAAPAATQRDAASAGQTLEDARRRRQKPPTLEAGPATQWMRIWIRVGG